MDVNDLVCDTLEEFLMECVGNKIEEVSELPKMLKDIYYLADKQELIEQTTGLKNVICRAMRYIFNIK